MLRLESSVKNPRLIIHGERIRHRFRHRRPTPKDRAVQAHSLLRHLLKRRRSGSEIHPAQFVFSTLFTYCLVF